MVDAVVQAFVDAKLERRDASVALYAVAPESGGVAVVARLAKKARTAMSSMLKTAPGSLLRHRFHRVYVLRRDGGRGARGPGGGSLAEDGGEPPHTSGSSGRSVLEQRSKVERSCPSTSRGANPE